MRAELEKHQAQTKRDYSLTYDKIVRDVIDVGDAAFSAHNYPTALKAKVLVGRHIGMWSNRPKLPRASEQTPVTANPVILRLEELTPQQRSLLKVIVRQAKLKERAARQEAEEGDDE